MVLGLAIALTAVLVGSTASAVPSGFVCNRGQIDPQVHYYARTVGADLFLLRDGLVLELRPLAAGPASALSHTVRLLWTGTGDAPVIEGAEPLPTHLNFIEGRQPATWRSNVPCFGRVIYRNIRPGVDIRVSLAGDALLIMTESSLEDPPNIEIRYEGASRVARTLDGIVRIETSVGTLIHDTRKGTITRGDGPDRSHGRDNPSSLRWSGFLGGSLTEYGYAITTRPTGAVLIAGTVDSPDFPATTGAMYDSLAGSNDVFIAEIDASGDRIDWATFLGGANVDLAQAIALTSSGDIFLAGKTESPDFPVTVGSYATSYGGGSDAFVAKVSADGSSLIWSSFLGGSGYEIAFGLIDVGAAGVVVGGYTSSSGYPTTRGAYDETFNGGFDCFLTKLDAEGRRLAWSTFVGGGNDDRIYDLACDGHGSVFMTAWTQSPDFPTTPGAYDRFYDGGGDAYVAKLASTGDSLLWSTLLGGADGDRAYGIALDAEGNPIVAGQTRSPTFPVTPGAFDTSFGGEGDGFVTKLDASGTRILWSGFLGGGADDRCLELAMDTDENVILVGSTTSPDFPCTPDGYDDSYHGNGDAFASMIRKDGTSLIWGTFLGGQGMDNGNALSLGKPPEILLTGETESPDFPATPGSFDPTWNGQVDAFVMKIAAIAPADVAISGSAGPLGSGALSVTPNPFAETTRIAVRGSSRSGRAISIFDVTGRLVRRLEADGDRQGQAEFTWDGTDDLGNDAPSGVYFLESVDSTGTRRLQTVTLAR